MGLKKKDNKRTSSTIDSGLGLSGREDNNARNTMYMGAIPENEGFDEDTLNNYGRR